MRESIDSFLDLKVYPPLAHKGGEVVFIYEFLWDISDFDSDILWLVQRSAKINC